MFLQTLMKKKNESLTESTSYESTLNLDLYDLDNDKTKVSLEKVDLLSKALGFDIDRKVALVIRDRFFAYYRNPFAYESSKNSIIMDLVNLEVITNEELPDEIKSRLKKDVEDNVKEEKN